jgi:hypothetical protein
MPPKRFPTGPGRNPVTVIKENNIIERRLIDLFLPGFRKISAIRTRMAAAVSSSSWRINEKSCKLILISGAK